MTMQLLKKANVVVLLASQSETGKFFVFSYLQLYTQLNNDNNGTEKSEVWISNHVIF